MKPIPQTRIVALFIAVSLALGLTGCETAPRQPTSEPGTPPSLDAATKAEQAGEYVLAAREYDRLARLSPIPQRQHYQLKTVEALLKAGQVNEAQEKLAATQVLGLDSGFLGRKQILAAQIAAAQGRPQQAIQLLNQAEKGRHLDPALLAQLYATRADAELALGNAIPAVKNLIGRERYIVAKPEILKNQQQLWSILGSVNRAALQKELSGAREPVLKAWLALALTAQENADSPGRLALAVEDWKKSYPEHSVSEGLLATLAKPPASLVGAVKRIALLLPLTSDYAQAAEAVRAGFMAMRNADTNPDKPEVKIYDIGANPTQAPAFYAQAANEGAQLIIGPLGLEATEHVAKAEVLKLPTVLLSHVELASGAETPIFQFGLPPEQEAKQVAERAYVDGRRRAAILYSNNSSGQRMAQAFRAYWEHLGGTIAAAEAYDTGQSDYSEPVKRLLNVTQSEARAQALETRVRAKLKFEARPREDIDAVFLAADPKHGRLIKPQLNYNRASQLPIYATSHIFAGKEDPAADVDLDGIVFGDMPWMLITGGKIERLRKSLQGEWLYARTPLDRLYALGMDAYAVIPQLDRLNLEDTLRFNGVTGGLSQGRDHKLQRQLVWARFRQGKPQLLDKGSDVKGQSTLEFDGGKAELPRPRS